MCGFDALLLMIKTAPEKAAEAVKMIEEMRARQLVAEAQEKAIIRSRRRSPNDGGTDDD